MTLSNNWSHDEDHYQKHHLPGWPAFVCYTKTHTLLPELRIADMVEQFNTVTSSRACADWLSVLIPPTLSALYLFRDFRQDNPGSIERYLNFVDGILSKCSNHLQRLKICALEPSIIQLIEDSPNDTSSISLLPGALISRALKHIVGMPCLEKLEIPELSTTLEVPPLPELSSCQLKSLHLLCSATEPVFRLWQTPITAHLTQLSLSTSWSGTSAVTEMHELMGLIAEKSPHLTKLSFYFSGISDTEHLLEALYPLHTLQLTQLIVNGMQLTQPPQQISLRKIAEYWPLLEVLEIRHVGTTFDELIMVSSYLPRLNCLLLRLESTIPPELISDNMASETDTRPSQELELVSDFRCVHEFSPSETDIYARFLTKIWRNLVIKCYCRGYKHGPEYEEFKVTLAKYSNGQLSVGAS